MTDRLDMANRLRALAAYVEAGEITGVAVCTTYLPTDESSMGSMFWTAADTGNLFSLVGAVHVLAARIVHEYGVD
jgi:hypothetical protein